MAIKPVIPTATLTIFEVLAPERVIFADWDSAVELADIAQSKVVNATPGEPRYLLYTA